MANNLLESIQAELSLRKQQWRKIAADLDYSYEFVSRLGLRKYASSPTFNRLAALDKWLREHPVKK